MEILKHISLLLLPLVLTGCYEEFDPAIDTESVLCINSLITAGEPVEVEVTHTWMYNNAMEQYDHSVDDAVVSVYANGELQDADYIPAEGDNIRIVAQSRKYGSAEASVMVPKAVPVASVEFIPEILSKSSGGILHLAMYGSMSFNMRIKLTIDDTDTANNYFELGGVLQAPWEDWTAPYSWINLGTFDLNVEPIFKEHIGVFESLFGEDSDALLVFSDRQFAGKSYTLNLQFNDAYYYLSSQEYNECNYDFSLEFSLASISQSYYDRSMYVWQIDSGILGDLGDLGFAEPLWGYSNVSTGAGVVMARSIATYTLSLRDFLKSSMEE